MSSPNSTIHGSRPANAVLHGGATLPNAISLLRCLSGPLVLLILAREVSLYTLGLLLAVLVLSEFSDYYDGFLARRRGVVSRLGMLLDPMADTLYRQLTFLAFVMAGWMPGWMLAVIIVREVVVIYLRAFCQQQNITLAARTTGKIKAVVQAAALLATVVFQIGILVIAASFPDLGHVHGVDIIAVLGGLTHGVLGAAALVTLLSGVDYVLHFVRIFDWSAPDRPS